MGGTEEVAGVNEKSGGEYPMRFKLTHKFSRRLFGFKSYGSYWVFNLGRRDLFIYWT